MATIGKMDVFDSSQETWDTYAERLEQYFLANDIAPDKQVPALLSLMGGKTYTLLRDLTSPDKPATKTFVELCDVLKSHYSPKPLVIAERFRFHKRNQREGESIKQYVAELKKLSQFCEFGNNLNESLRDRLVCGIVSVPIQKKLLSEANLTLAKAVDISTAMEMASRDVMELHGKQTTTSDINKVTKEGGQARKSVGQRKKSRTSTKKPCYRCGGKHNQDVCFYKDTECYNCSKKGHIASVCRAAKKDSPSRHDTDRHVSTNKHLDLIDDDDDVYPVFRVGMPGNAKIDPYHVEMDINGTSTRMEIDTGAAVTILSEDTFRQVEKGQEVSRLKPTKARLRTYTGEEINVMGEVQLPVEYGSGKHNLSALVVHGKGPSLLGRDWLSQVRLDWDNIFYNKCVNDLSTELEDVIKKHSTVFKKEMGTLKEFMAKIQVDEDASPKYFKARPVPYALRGRIEVELDRLIAEGIIQPVQSSDWAAPIVPVVKPDGTIRICGDYKITVNRVSKLAKYPIPKTEDLLATLGGGSKFTKLDLRHAYLQLQLDDASKPFTTVSTHRGLFQYNRLPFGVSSSPGIFQCAIEHLVEGIPCVKTRLDDILISGPDDTCHLSTLSKVLDRLENAGVRLNLAKCKFMEPDVVFCGRVVSESGTRPTDGNVKAIRDAPTPKNATELKSFLGMINFYHMDLPNLSTLLEPLHMLLRKNVHWKWGAKQERAFSEAKQLLSSPKFLVHYDEKKELILEVDASDYGVGAVISHIMDDGSEKPVAYTSRTLAPAERNYSQIDKEALAVIYGVKKFHQYIYGRHVTIYTDHKPLIGLLGEDKAIPGSASPRMQRWALILAGYEYSLKFKAGKNNEKADCLSRLPLQEMPAKMAKRYWSWIV